MILMADTLSNFEIKLQKKNREKKNKNKKINHHKIR